MQLLSCSLLIGLPIVENASNELVVDARQDVVVSDVVHEHALLLLFVDGLPHLTDQRDAALELGLRVLYLNLLSVNLDVSRVSLVNEDLDLSGEPALAVPLGFYLETFALVLLSRGP